MTENENDFVVKNGKKLRRGFTTGSCAAAAAVSALYMLFTKIGPAEVKINLPIGDTLALPVEDAVIKGDTAFASIIKDAGDDPDVTHGIKITCAVSLINSGIEILGGAGVGFVKAKGLKQKIGEPAINPVPRKMIAENLENLAREYNYSGGVRVIIMAENGEEIAKKTFNPRLGIEGGISILGTTGFVEPMSEKALVDTIKILVDKYKTINPEKIIISPGNYGKTFLSDILHKNDEQIIKYSNFLGETLDYIRYQEFKKILLVGHIGKMVKVAGGVMNTHSKIADCRSEIFAAHTAMFCESREKIKIIMSSNTTDEIIGYLREWNILDEVMESLLERIMFQLNYRVLNEIEIGVIIFSGDEILVKSENADILLED